MKPETSLVGSSRVTKEQAKNAVAASLHRLVRDHGKQEVASAMGCDKRTVENALAHCTLPETHLLVNLLNLDITAMNELLALKGLHAVPLDSALCPHMETVSMMGSALSTFLDALRDGKVVHTEKLTIAEQLRPLLPVLTALVHEADGLRRVA